MVPSRQLMQPHCETVTGGRRRRFGRPSRCEAYAVGRGAVRGDGGNPTESGAELRRWEPVTRRLLPLMILLCVSLLAGCHLDVVVDVNMANNGSGVITVTAVADAELVNSQPGLIDDLDLQDEPIAPRYGSQGDHA